MLHSDEAPGDDADSEISDGVSGDVSDEQVERDVESVISGSSEPAERRVRPWLRLLGLALLVAGGWAFVLSTGLIDSFEEAKLRALVGDAGVYGVLVFVVAFVGAQMLHLPGSVFIAVASLAWGWSAGSAISWAASVIAVSVNFTFVKAVGGDMLVAVDRPLLDKILRHLHQRPRLTVLVARAVFMTSPWLTTTLALAGVSRRDHFGASALGMAPQILLWTTAVDLLV